MNKANKTLLVVDVITTAVAEEVFSFLTEVGFGKLKRGGLGLSRVG